MKRNILKYILVMFLGLSLFSCDDFDQDINYYDSVKLSLSARTFSVLDSELPTTIDFISTTEVVTDVVVLKDGVALYSGTATDNKFSFTLKRADLGLNKIGDSQRIYVNATVDGKVKEMYTTISMKAASSISVPLNEDDEDEPVYELSDVVKNFTYKVSPKTATGVTVTASVKVGESGTYAQLWSKAYNASDLNIAIKGSDYSKGDEVFVMLVAKVGTFTDTVTSSIEISEYLLGSLSSATVNIEEPGYDLVGDSIIDVAEAACMVQFTNDFANLYQGITTLNGAELVLIDNEDLMTETNLPVLKAAFDGGTAITTVPNVVKGDKFIVKTTRNEKDYYGTFEVTGLNENRIEADDFVRFDFVIEEYDTQK